MVDGPPLPFPDRRLPDLIAEHATRRPDAIAIRQWESTLTYRELAGQAAALAALLPDRPLIGLCADRTPMMITGLVGILGSGAGYVPLDPALPSGRLQDIAREAGLRTVVCDAAGAAHFAGTDLELIDLARGRPAVPTGSCPAGPQDCAYVMFTSGSTGRPKGVVITHEALTEFVTGMAHLAGLDQTAISLGFASIGFDASVIDVLTPLAAGGTVALASTVDRADPVRLRRFCAEHRVSVAFLPPAVLPMLDPAGLPALSVVLTGSEAPGPEQVARWASPTRRFLNLYGPTEATVLVTWFEATGSWDGPLPIGVPAPNHRVYVVDENLRELGVGRPGELLAGGIGLAQGYLGDAGRTAERFVPDPFSTRPGARLYRTGDLACWQEDGTLRFLGRTDRQVKIRGQRIELGEVESVLRGHPDVEHAAVTVRGTELVAFVTGTPDPKSVREHCAIQLPAAMVPARVRVLAELPLASSGKVDLDALVDEPDRTRPTDPPQTQAEKQLAELWSEIVGGAPGREDDFFDAGGHSITAMRLVAAIRSRLDRDVAVEDVLAGRTLRAIAATIESAGPLPNAPVRGRPPALSPSQQRLWFLDHYSPEAAAAYNVALAERLRGPLDVPALTQALTAVATRHEVLRWRITESGGRPQAVLDPPGPMPLPVVDLSALPDREQQLARLLSTDARKRFALATDTLWRATLYRLGPEEHVLAITAHHAVFDGWSQSLLYADLASAYRTGELPPLPATYADYVAWRADRREQRGRTDLDWHLSHVDDAPVVLELPTDRPRPAEQTFAAGQAGVLLDEATTTGVTALATELGTTPAAVLLAAFGVLLLCHTGQPDLIIGSPMVDRRETDFQDMVGFFIEIAALRLNFDPAATFAASVRAARDELLAALAHPEAPLDRIVPALGLGGQLARNPLVQVLFNMFTFTEPRLELPGLDSEPVPVAAPGSPFDLTLYGAERDGRLRLDLVYNADLFTLQRMRGLLDDLRVVLERGASDSTITVGQLAGPRPDPTPVQRATTKRVAPVGSSAPATATERAIAAVWCEVLGRADVGATESFFDAGGSSVLIVAVQQGLRRAIGRELRVVELFRYPTVRALAAMVDGNGTGTDTAVERAARRGAARRDRGRQRRSTG
jgi:amino acid adenylation domain-containing protein